MFLPVIKPLLRTALLIVSIIVYALTILSAYGGRFDPDFFTFPSLLTLALPWLAIATLLITVAWFASGHLFAGGLGVLSIIASWGPISTACPLSGQKNPTPGAQTFTVLTYNIIHGWDLEDKSGDGNRTLEYIINSGADIVCVQELIDVSDNEMPNYKAIKEALDKAYPYQAGDPSLDMKVLSKYPVVFEKGYNYIDGDFDPKRYTFYKLNINGKRLTLINVHLSSFNLKGEECNVVTDLKSVEGMKKSIKELSGPIRKKMTSAFKTRKHDVKILRETIDRMKGAMIICGDFNDVPESYAYRLLRGTDLKDAYVETGFGPLVTYNLHSMWFHLDQIFYRGPLRALSVEKGKLKSSDHYPLMAEFEFTE